MSELLLGIIGLKVNFFYARINLSYSLTTSLKILSTLLTLRIPSFSESYIILKLWTPN